MEMDSVQEGIIPQGRIQLLPALERRARLLITNSSVPRPTRSLIRYALEVKDPYLAQIVRRVEGRELMIECLDHE